LNKGRVSDVLRVFHGPCRIIAMFLEITEAVQNAACNMSWVLRSDEGGYRVIGDTVNIQAAALGDFFVAELDATNIVGATTGTALVNGYWYDSATANGAIVPPGGIDFVFSNTNMSSGKGTLTIAYLPIVDDAMIVAEDWQTSTTSSSTSTSSTSSTASTSSTTSTTSSTASSSSTTSTTSTTSSTASTTSSTSSTASTTSTTSSTSSTASTTSTTSSTSTTTSTTSTASSTSTTSSTSSTTTTWPPEVP